MEVEPIFAAFQPRGEIPSASLRGISRFQPFRNLKFPNIASRDLPWRRMSGLLSDDRAATNDALFSPGPSLPIAAVATSRTSFINVPRQPGLRKGSGPFFLPEYWTCTRVPAFGRQRLSSWFPTTEISCAPAASLIDCLSSRYMHHPPNTGSHPGS